MYNTILFDDYRYKRLLPLVYTIPVAELRCGILSISEKWSLSLKNKISYLSRDYLNVLFPLKLEKDNLLINSRLLPTADVLHAVKTLKPCELLSQEGTILALRCPEKDLMDLTHLLLENNKSALLTHNDIPEKNYEGNAVLINYLWDLFSLNGSEIKSDLELLKANSDLHHPVESQWINSTHNIYIHKTARLEQAFIDATSGPVYIGKNAHIMQGSMIRGPVAICENSVIKMGAKIYEDTTIGPYCKVGGEISNSIFTSYSSKAHDGYIGNSVIGSWCNLGADTNCSNLKNNYKNVKVWSYETESFIDTGLQFCGLFMGDHSKTGINTMLNTGTVIGVASNIFGPGFPRTYIPSFSWGGSQGLTDHSVEKALETADIVMKRRNLELTEKHQEILKHIYNNTLQEKSGRLINLK